MAKGINKAILVGNLGNDPEVRHTASGGVITRVSLATSTSWKDKQSGEQKERTEWHRVVFFGRLAEIAGEYLRKGSQVYIEGEIRYDKYTDKDGVEKYSTDIAANEMQMLGGRGEGGAPRAATPPTRKEGGTGPVEQAGDGFDDDDIPFVTRNGVF